MLDQRLATQSRGRDLSATEQALAAALEAIFSTGTHDFDAVAAALQDRGVARPSGGAGEWSRDVLMTELVAINASLDAAYTARGIGV